MPPGSPHKPNPWEIDYANLISPTYWALELPCDLNTKNSDPVYAWIDCASEKAQFPTQPIGKDIDSFPFELASEKKGRETNFSDSSNSRAASPLIKARPGTFQATTAKRHGERRPTHLAFSMKVSRVREKRDDSVLWCNRDAQGSKAHEMWLELEKEFQ
ncbi:hypothetical protein DSL72_002040 [Monilinia vaccinii-corymbosi]|uniref:Uncharacterized protein n=1 Tax=Monilinia vaccinii-corymbosi TaxID=61207 RepID=A0A8A3PBH8_9HELO|nr:hypothetical protein DSL72_002040 [Monilinia vaccinii-corymbosi]